MKDKIDYIIETFNNADIALTNQQAQRFFAYYEYLIEYNQHVNLTRIIEFAEVVQKHFLDSVALLKADYILPKSRLVDIGTGAGFPGVPLAIMRGDVHVTLIDSLNKRVTFLNNLIEKLALDNITTVHARAEDAGLSNIHREKYDIVLSRAVARLNVLCEYNLAFAKIGGIMAAYKGPLAEEEILEAKNAIKILGGKYIETFSPQLNGTDQHNIIIIKKISKTPTKYPRKAGEPTKNPIK